MTTPPTFVSGAILTAAQMNAIGLWQVSSTTVGSAVTTHVVSNCFSTDYVNYKLVINGMTGTDLGAALFLKPSATTGSTYFGNDVENVPGTASIAAVSSSNATSTGMWLGRISTSGIMGFEAVIYSPFLATTTNLTNAFAGRNYNGSGGTHDSNAASSTGFTLFVSAGTISAGTVKVYGIN